MTRRFGAEEPAKVPAKGQGEGTLSQPYTYIYILVDGMLYIYMIIYICDYIYI